MPLKSLVSLRTRPLLSLLLLASASQSCKTPDDEPSFTPTLYAGNSATASVERDQAKEVIKASDPKFDDMICMYNGDLLVVFKQCLAKKEADAAWYKFGKNHAPEATPTGPETAVDDAND